jgi:hypothetical protein
MVIYLNEKEKRENITIDKMDWMKVKDEFLEYLKKQDE